MHKLQQRVILQEVLWGPKLAGALWPFQPLGWQYLRPLHLHSQPELFVMRRGTLTLEIGAESHRMQRGDVAWILPSVEHRTHGFSRDADFWVLQPEPALLESAFTRLETAPARARDPRTWLARLVELVPDPTLFRPSRAEFAILEECAELAWRSYLGAWQAEPASADDSAPSSRLAWIPPWSERDARVGRELLSSMLLEALRITKAAQRRERSLRLARDAFDLLLCEPGLSRVELCDRLSVSEGHLSRQFPGIFAASLVGQRARVRLMAFLALTKSRLDANMLSASFSAGFGSYTQLHRVFTAYSASGPREYLYGGGDIEAARITL